MRKLRKYPHLIILPIVLCLFASDIFLSGCRKEVRVTVTNEAILRANEAAKLGDAAFSRKDYYAALVKYLESVQLNPNNIYVYNTLGITYSQLKYFEKAADAFSHSMALNPKYPYPYNNMGSILLAQNSLKKAERYFRKAISLKADEASFHLNLGSLYLERKRRDKAMAEWHKALALDPKILSKNVSVNMISSTAATIERRYFTARLLASVGNVESAIENLQIAITDGFSDLESIRKEPDFDPIRNDKRFIEFLENAETIIKLRAKTRLSEEPKK